MPQSHREPLARTCALPLSTGLAPFHVTTWPTLTPASARTVVLLHGFMGDGQDWAPLVEALDATDIRHDTLHAIDLIGHGRSPANAAPEDFTMSACVKQVTAALEHLCDGPVILIGYSMGGRVALQVACDHPERVAALMLIGATPGLARAEERAAREEKDAGLAARVEREGVAAFWAFWRALPIIATQERIAPPHRDAMFARRLTRDARGLAASLRGMGTGAMPSRWDDLPTLHTPTLLVTGAADEKFCAIAARMVAAMPDATHHIIPDAGHTAHLEQPDAVAARIDRFLQTRR